MQCLGQFGSLVNTYFLVKTFFGGGEHVFWSKRVFGENLFFCESIFFGGNMFFGENTFLVKTFFFGENVFFVKTCFL